MDSAPTPSQDAEGDGRGGSPETPWVRMSSAVNRTRLYGRTNGSGREDRHQISESLAVAIESAIRADYEELVRAVKLSLLTQCEDAGTRRVRAALTRIEESLGGRKDV